MTLLIEIRKLQPDFGVDKWAIRIGDIAGSTEMHNFSKKKIIKAIISEMKDEAKITKEKEKHDRK